MTNQPFRHAPEIRFSDVDAMGHVNNAVYFTYLEQARLAFCRMLTGARRIEDIRFILAHVECDYRVPIRLGDEVETLMTVGAVGRTSFSFDYTLVDRENGRIFATARTVQVMYDYAQGKPIPIPDDLRDALRPFVTTIAATP
jgi:acyl-CoA thioester hydrolase